MYGLEVAYDAIGDIPYMAEFVTEDEEYNEGLRALERRLAALRNETTSLRMRASVMMDNLPEEAE